MKYGSEVWIVGRHTVHVGVNQGRPTAPFNSLLPIPIPIPIPPSPEGGKDRLSDGLDMEYLREELGAGVVVRELHVSQYEHLDFIWGQDAAELVYAEVVEELRSRADTDEAFQGG